MKRFLWVLIGCSMLFFSYCKSKKNKFAEGDKIKTTDFIHFYTETKLPLAISDSIFLQKNTDTISYSAFAQCVPDSVLEGIFHKSKPQLFSIGKITVKAGETYLLTKATSSSKKAVYITVFDNKDSFKTAMPLIVADKDKTTFASATMDSRYTITLLEQQSKSNESMLYKKDVYVYNSAGIFTLIVTESNKDKKPEDVINPIDTFPAKNKFAGDYTQDKKNFVSFRDSRKASHVLFFVHFEKDDGTCKGELKGEAKIISDKVVRFSESGSPCEIDFTFEGKNVNMKELGGCGSYRDIKCFFEGPYVRKVPAKIKTKKNKP